MNNPDLLRRILGAMHVGPPHPADISWLAQFGLSALEQIEAEAIPPQPDTALTVERLAEAMHREWPGVTKVCHPPETCRHRARAANILRALGEGAGEGVES